MSSNECVLSMGGAFNPVHSQHIDVMRIARDYLEKEKGLIVREGYLAPAHDGYVRNKMKGNPMIPKTHRINMVNLAVRKLEWLKPVSRCFGSALECAVSSSPPDCLKVIICGADRAMSGNVPKWRKQPKNQPNVLNLIIGRPGETDRIKRLWEEDNLKGTDNTQYMFVTLETEDVSSTKIRDQLLSSDDKNECLKRLVENNLLDEQVADYIKQNQSSLFITN